MYGLKGHCLTQKIGKPLPYLTEKVNVEILITRRWLGRYEIDYVSQIGSM